MKFGYYNDLHEDKKRPKNPSLTGINERLAFFVVTSNFWREEGVDDICHMVLLKFACQWTLLFGELWRTTP
jgi:hypothetical protein